MNIQAVRVLLVLTGIVVVLGLAIIAVPIYFRPELWRQSHSSLTLYFAAIGVGFMLMEIGHLQRLSIFLGHPVYGITVVLFSLLVASSVGSACAGRFQKALWLSIPVFASLIYATPTVVAASVALSTVNRITISTLLLLPFGFFMGMFLPIGLQTAQRHAGQSMAAWYWAVNGAFSVTASVVAVLITIFNGITATLYVALSAYFVAVVLINQQRGHKRPHCSSSL